MARIVFASLELMNGAVLTHAVEATSKLELTVSGVVSVDATSSIDLSSRGQSALAGVTSYAGGSYGGRGGFYGDNESAAEYGSYLTPFEHGSGSTSRRGGGGSGGAVWLQLNTLSGSGSINANGGSVPPNLYGSGGRVALYYQQNSDFNLASVTATGGVVGAGAGSNPGQDGTVHIDQKTLPVMVVSSQPKSGDLFRDPVSSINLEFLSPVNAASFTVEDVSLVDPAEPFRLALSLPVTVSLSISPYNRPYLSTAVIT